MGHFHPTELIADKISAILQFADELLLHVSRPMRWDSDHIVILSDDLRCLAEELVRSGHIDKTYIGLDFFDATLNRIGAWVLGSRSTLKALLLAYLQPHGKLLQFEEEGDYFSRLALLEELKSMPFGTVWDHYCEMQGVPKDDQLIDTVMEYERNVILKR